METCDLNDIEFKIAVLKKNKIQKTQIDSCTNSEIKSTKKKHFTKGIETLTNNQLEILEIKNSIKEGKYEPANLGNKADQLEKKIVISKIDT